jgi:antitoxin component of MazEF toxin-antitoxin module
MIKNLTRHGNSLALVIDKPVLDLLGIDADTPLEMTTDGRALVVEPARGEARRKKIAKLVAEGNQKYGRMLKRLAD